VFFLFEEEIYFRAGQKIGGDSDELPIVSPVKSASSRLGCSASAETVVLELTSTGAFPPRNSLGWARRFDLEKFMQEGRGSRPGTELYSTISLASQKRRSVSPTHTAELLAQGKLMVAVHENRAATGQIRTVRICPIWPQNPDSTLYRPVLCQ
jgi:hypothetical protein